MKQIIRYLIIAVTCFCLSCSKTNSPEPTPTPTQPTQPTLAITDFNPKSASVGATVMITGTAFGTDVNAVGVKFGTSAITAPKTVTATSMSVIVPNDAKTGKIQLTVGNSTVTTISDFTLTTVASPTPTITSFSPQTASVGDVVTINGTNFGTDTNFVSVKFGTATGIKPKTVSATTMTVIVPSTAISGKIQIEVNGGTAVSTTTDFTLKPTFSITSFAPKTFTEGDTVVITGTNFGTNANNVSVALVGTGNTIKPYSVTNNAISFIVPNEGGFNLTNKITLSITGFSDVTSTDNFSYLLPVQAVSIDQASARAGEIVNIQVQINHTNFGVNVANLSSLSFNFGSSSSVTPLSAGNNGVVAVRVPADATTGKIKASYTSYKTGLSTFTFTKLAALTLQSGAWTAGANFKTTGKVGSIAFVIGTKAYVGMGSTNAPFDGIGSPDIWEFDSQYNTWTQKANYGGGQRAYAVAFAVNGKGYVGTGVNENNTPTSDMWEYDPTANTWAQKANFKGGVRTGGTGFAIGSLGYVGAGSGTSGSLSDFYSYNPATNAWTQTASITGARSQAYSFVVGNNAYVGNGFNTNITNSYLDLNMYDPTTNSWTVKAPIPSFTTYASVAFSIGNNGYAGLGTASNTSPNNKFYQYSTTNNTWTAIANYGGAGRMAAVGFAIGNVGYVGMGTTFSNLVAIKDFWAYTP